MNNLAILAPVLGVAALLFAAYLSKRVSNQDAGTDRMKEIAAFIHEGAQAFLMAEYKILIVFVAVLFVLIGFGISWPTSLAFLLGALFSTIAGYCGMNVATKANVRTAAAAKDSGMNKALSVAFSGGAVMGMCVVGLGLLGCGIVYLISGDPNVLSGFSLGASSIALFARVGGGIYTKAADVGADLVGKVEAGIPEDDPRNPAVIADNVGDNVGDVAGMGADLYESYVSSVISASALGVSAFGGDVKAMAVPMLMAAIGIVMSILGTFFVRTGENISQKLLLKALSRGTNLSAIGIAIVALPIVIFVLGKENWGLYVAILSGLLAGVLIGKSTEYYTSDTYKPTKKLAATSETGSATIIIGGLGLGMKSTALPIVIVGISVLISYFASGGSASASMGLYGIALSAVGMLSTLGITLATDAYGPVADNAGGIAEMAGLPSEVRERTDALDSLGNTTAATGKGFAIGSAALTALALVASYVDKIKSIDPTADMSFDIVNPVVLIGLFVGGCLPFVFAALTMESVGKAAQSVVKEVRRQFKEIAGLMEGESEPDYASCVDLCTKASLREMVLPTIVAVVVPVVVGIVLGYKGVVGMLAGATVSGFLMAIFMSNSGGAWDNAKKYIESGVHGGKGSEQHKGAVVGDTVGDPFKDTSGPAINILIKLLSMVSIVFAALVVKFSIF